MAAHTDLAVIESKLTSLRLRIRRVQLWRGACMVVATLLLGIFLAMGLDLLIGLSLPKLRWGAFMVLILTLTGVTYRYLIRPLTRKISLLQVARWLETQHPEIEERISTALHFSREARGVAPEIVEELCASASTEIRDFHPGSEVSSRLVRRSFLSAAGLLGLLVLLFVIWPGQVSRLLLRAVIPVTSSGNAGAVYFKIKPGDLEVLAGDELMLKISYQGDLSEGLILVTDLGEETLQPISHEGDHHEFVYRLAGASRSFRYHARVGTHESDRYRVTVWPKPRLQNVRVNYRYPAYTGLPPQEAELGTGLKALVGTQLTLTGNLNTQAEWASFEHGEKKEKLIVEPSSTGGSLTWAWQLTEDASPLAAVLLKHRLAEEPEILRFSVEALKDAVPIVSLKSPYQRQLRMRPDDELVLRYQVEEVYGLTAVELDLDVNGQPGEALKKELPERLVGETEHLWEGKVRVELLELKKLYPDLRHFRLRLKLSDNRPADLAGPGVGYSEWLEVTLDEKAPLLLRQQLKSQQADLQKAFEKAQRDIRKVQQKMYQTRPHLEKELLPTRVREALAEGRSELAATEKDLQKLAQEMTETVQAHRSPKVREIARQLAQVRSHLEYAPLQDTTESRQSEIDAALRESHDALAKLQKLRDEVNQDRHKINQLARLEELAQKQDSLARNFNEDEKQWRQQQKRVNKEVAKMIRLSPEATAASLEKEAEHALSMVRQAEELTQQQGKLAQGLSVRDLKSELRKAQEQFAGKVAEALAQAHQGQQKNANDLADASAKAQEAAETLTPETTGSSLESLKKAQAGEALLQGQESINASLSTLEKGDLEQALAAYRDQQSKDAHEFASQVKKIPQIEGRSGHMEQAERESRGGAANAKRAAHKQASSQFQASAEALKQAAQEATAKSNQFSQQEANPNELSLPAKPMAEAFQESAAAAEGRKESAQAAAESLQQAVRKARQAMAQGRSANESRSTFENQAEGEEAPVEEPAEEAQPQLQQAQSRQGVPPQLAKLGISAEDWQKIKTQMNSGVHSPGSFVIPEGYRELTQKYFQQLAKER